MELNKYLSLATWNMKCNFDISKKYLKALSLQADVILIQEHGLFPCQIPKLGTVLKDYDGFGRASSQLKDQDVGNKQGIGGCGILWRKSMCYKVKRHLNEGSDRICVIELILKKRRVFIICVYMPHQTCHISNFLTELNKLKTILDKFMPQGVCIVLGDWNINFGPEVSKRCNGNPTIYAKNLKSMLTTYDLTVVDLGEKGRGPCYTFVGGHGTSYLDHVIVPTAYEHLVISTEVLEDCIENISDHLPIVVKSRISFYINEAVSKLYSSRIAWNKMTDEEIQERYTEPLENECWQILERHGFDPLFVINLPEFCALDYEELDTILQEVIQTCVNVGDTLKSNQFCRHIKPFWTDKLEELNGAIMKRRKEWRSKYESEERSNPEFDTYKESKKEFRKQYRIEERDYERSEMNKLNLSGEIDQKYFWYLVNRFKQKIITPIMSDEGEVLTEPVDIQKDWNNYYEKLYSEGEDEHYDDEFKDFVTGEVRNIDLELRHDKESKYLTGGPITFEDIDKIVKSMANGKAAGYDKMTSEHLKNSGVLLKSIVTWIINGMIKHSAIPKRLKKGLIVSIPKPEKDSVIKGNNRGLTLLPTLYKLFEKVIMNREDNWIQKTVAPIQSCGKNHVSCTHTSFVVQQAVGIYRNLLKTVYGGFLDTQKAFDTLWILGLLYKLYLAKMNVKAWLLIQNAYTDFECTAYVNGLTGHWFIPLRGVHQGAPLSMILYTIFINGLLVILKRNPNGLCIHNSNLCSPAHADDVTLLTLQKTGLNSMLSDSFLYSVKWRYQYNLPKTVLMIWGTDHYPHIKVTFGGKTYLPSDECKHMGTILQPDNKNEVEVCQKRISKAKNAIFAGLGIGGCNVTTSPTTMSKIYWSVAVPKMMYGIETTPLSDRCLELMETAHRQHANLIQNLPDSTPKPSSLSLLGWQSMRSFVAYVKIMFMIRVLCLSSESLYRNFMLMSINIYNGLNGKPERYMTPVGDAMQYVKFYGLTETIENCVRDGDWKQVTSLKSKVRKTISEYEARAWRSTCVLYRRLALYCDVIKERKIIIWWEFVRRCSGTFKRVSTVVALLCGTQPRGYGANFGHYARCQICTSYEMETILHVLFDCETLSEMRERVYGPLLNSMPIRMRQEYEAMDKSARLKFLLSGFLVDKYVPEWQDLYMKTSTFVYEVYKARRNRYEFLNLVGTSESDN